MEKIFNLNVDVKVEYDENETQTAEIIKGVNDAFDYYHNMLIEEGYCDFPASIVKIGCADCKEVKS